MRRLVALALLVCGCGDPLVEGTFKPPYFTLDLIVTRMAGFLPHDVNAAVLWQNDLTAGHSYATQLFTFGGAQLTGSFTLPINALPPAEAIHSILPLGSGVDPAMRFAAGTLVLYADNNGNGRLDISDVVARDAAHDEIVAAAERLDIFYLAAGEPAPAPFVGILPIARGFSLVKEPLRSDPALGSCDQFNARGHLSERCQLTLSDGPTALADSAPIDLEIVDDPLLQRYDCANFWGPELYPDDQMAPADQICDSPSCPFCAGYTCPLDLPPPGLMPTCNLSGTIYSYRTCTNLASLCDTTVCHYGHGARLATDPVPPGWPCPTP